MSEFPAPETLLPLTPAAFHILLALSHQELHGYAIMQAIETLSRGTFRVGPGTLYRSIKQMVEQRLIEPSDARPDPALDDERRRYYRITPFGLRVAAVEALRMAELAQRAREQGLLDPGSGNPAFGGES